MLIDARFHIHEDTGERYLPTPLAEAIEQEMDSDELAISDSTPL
ncbi:hypothetical protein RQ479_13975 [Mesorhizobium sp. ISC25]